MRPMRPHEKCDRNEKSFIALDNRPAIVGGGGMRAHFASRPETNKLQRISLGREGAFPGLLQEKTVKRHQLSARGRIITEGGGLNTFEIETLSFVIVTQSDRLSFFFRDLLPQILKIWPYSL